MTSVGTVRAAGERNVAWQGLWEEMFGKSGWMPTAAGVKNAFKVGYHVVDWSKYFSEEPLPVEMLNFRGALKDSKNAFGLTELPGKAKKAVNSVFAFMHGPQRRDDQIVGSNYIGLGYKAALDVAGVISPLNDSAEFFNSRVAPIASQTMKELGQLNAAALFFSMTDLACKDVGRIWRATKVLVPTVQKFENYVVDWAGGEAESDDEADAIQVAVPPRRGEIPHDPEFEAEIVLELNLIDLAKCVSYIALASIALFSAFVAAIPSASFWILVSSTSALAFTIIGEFRQRYFRSAIENYPENLPPDITAPRNPPVRGVMRGNGLTGVFSPDGS